MVLLKGKYYTFHVPFGAARAGKTVQYQILDYDLSVKQAYTDTGIVELGGGEYGVRLSFNETFAGYIRFKETESNYTYTQAITVIDDYAAQIATIFSVETGRWKIINNQMFFYDAQDQVILTFDLKDAAGQPTMSNPVERTPA